MRSLSQLVTSNNALERTVNHRGALCHCEWVSRPAAQLGLLDVMWKRRRSIFALVALVAVLACSPKRESPAQFSGAWKIEGRPAALELKLSPDGGCELTVYTHLEGLGGECTYSIKGQTLTLLQKDQAPWVLRYDAQQQTMSIQVGESNGKLIRIAKQ